MHRRNKESLLMTTLLTLDGTLPFAVELAPAADVPSEFIGVFESYWDAVEWPETHITRWSGPVSTIEQGLWGNDTSSAAGAGGTATVIDGQCVNCLGPLAITSRAAFDQVQRGLPVKCRNCTANFNERVGRITSPEAVAKRLLRARDKRREADDDQLRADVSRARRDAVQGRYGTFRGDDAPSVYEVGVDQLVAALAIIRHHMQDGVTVPFDEDDGRPLAPNSSVDRFRSTMDASGLLAVHASTPTSAFLWSADSGEGSSTFADRWYLGRLRLHRDTGESAAEAAAALAAEISDVLPLDQLTTDQQEELLLLARDLIAEEGIAYLEYQLSRYDLPRISEQHQSRLVAVMSRAADHLTLGNIYQLAWSASSAATNLLQSVRTSRDKASTHALNRLEKRLAEAIEKPTTLLEPYGLIDQVPLSSMSSVLFNEVFCRDITSASVANLRESMPASMDVRLRSICREGLDDGGEAADSLLARLPDFGGQQFRQALATFESNPEPVFAHGCSHHQANYLAQEVAAKWDKLVSRLGGDGASIAIIQLLPWLNRRSAEYANERPGDVLLVKLARVLVEAPASD